MLRLDLPGCNVVTRGEEAALRQVSADCVAMPAPLRQPSLGRCEEGFLSLCLRQSQQQGCNMRRRGMNKTHTGQHVPQGEKEKQKLGVEEQDDEEVVITVQCTFYLKHPLLQISWRVCARPPPVFSPVESRQ